MCTLAKDGDYIEKNYWDSFIEKEFPNYEAFWAKFVVPLTNRPTDIHFKPDSELITPSKTKEVVHQEICIAQLTYSVLRHLARAYDLRNLLESNVVNDLPSKGDGGSSASDTETYSASATNLFPTDTSALGRIFIGTPISKVDNFTSKQLHAQLDILTEGMVRIYGAQDVAFELLGRMTNKNRYEPWLEKGVKSGKKLSSFGGKEARNDWMSANQDALKTLKPLRKYRDHLVHGRLTPINYLRFPDIEKSENYLDWRKVTQGSIASISSEFVEAKDILKQAWDETLKFLNDAWEQLLKTLP